MTEAEFIRRGLARQQARREASAAHKQVRQGVSDARREMARQIRATRGSMSPAERRAYTSAFLRGQRDRRPRKSDTGGGEVQVGAHERDKAWREAPPEARPPGTYRKYLKAAAQAARKSSSGYPSPAEAGERAGQREASARARGLSERQVARYTNSGAWDESEHPRDTDGKFTNK